MDMTTERWRYTEAYSNEVFGREDDLLGQLMIEAKAAGLPDIAISADVGRLISMLTSTTRGKLAIEVGTLGGYSAIWLTRGLAPAGKLITIEPEQKHIDFALRQFKRAKLDHRIELRRGTALQILPQLARELPAGSVDVIFLDAIKTEYPEYWRIVRPLIAPDGWLIADNAYGSGSWWIDCEGDPTREAVDTFNRSVAGDRDFESVAIPMRQGLLIARRKN
jgi:predicted O-methyltransferase YrrM